jgi:hypothetical protein
MISSSVEAAAKAAQVSMVMGRSSHRKSPSSQLVFAQSVSSKIRSPYSCWMTDWHLLEPWQRPDKQDALSPSRIARGIGDGAAALSFEEKGLRGLHAA